MEIPEEVLNAPAEGRGLKCLHEAALISEGIWRVYRDASSDVLPLAQRRGDVVWIVPQVGVYRKLPIADLRRHCGCPRDTA